MPVWHHAEPIARYPTALAGVDPLGRRHAQDPCGWSASVPFNTALRHRARHDGATRKSLAAYARAGSLYATYCAHQGIGLLDVTNDEFSLFVDGLLGVRFRNARGEFVHLDGHARSRASADLYLRLLYSLT